MTNCGIASLCLFITIDRLTFIPFKNLTPTFFFINACISKIYKEAEKYFALFAKI